MPEFHRRSVIDAPASAVWDFHARPGAFARLCPPWQSLRVESAQGTLADTNAVIVLRKGPLKLRWHARHDPAGFIDGAQFVDDQVKGPFARWRHVHRVEPLDGPDAPAPSPGGAHTPRCALDDRIDYALPLGAIGRLLGGGAVRRDLEAMFRFRHRRTACDVRAHALWADRPRLRVAVTGSTGLIGGELVPYLLNAGHSIDRLVRAGTPRGPAGLPTRRIPWEPEAALLDATPLDGCDAVVHLAGANIAARRWSAEYKRQILDTRVRSTALLARALARLKRPPRVLVVASGASAYQPWTDGGPTRECDESAPLGDGFLASVVRQWEAASEPAAAAGVRVVLLRIGVVLSARGGALPKLAAPARLLLGGRIGSGRQPVPFIAMDDLLGVIERAIHDERLSGPVNAVAPAPATNDELTRAVARAVGRPRLAGAPGWAVRLIAGELAGELLSGCRAVPRRLLEVGHRFEFDRVDDAVAFQMGRG